MRQASDVDTLLAAAALMRERIAAATTGRWVALTEGTSDAGVVGAEGRVLVVEHDQASRPDAEHIATTDPPFLATVATMLEREAEIRRTQPRGFYEVREADLIATTYLRTEEIP